MSTKTKTKTEKKEKRNYKLGDSDRTIHLVMDGEIHKTYSGRESIVKELEKDSTWVGVLLRDGKYKKSAKYGGRHVALIYGDKLERKELTKAEIKEKIDTLKKAGERAKTAVRVECTILKQVFFCMSVADAAKLCETTSSTVALRMKTGGNDLIWKRWKVGIVAGDELRMLQEGKYNWVEYADTENK